ncbi:Bug family tripartite tricarboxylate transporter substrate binding protein [Falsiroseomonas ponticola]|uniref:Bug family tripartite tricarboxylate transporter substrate binding protein n=1 Tax=Falsiroseomonas ponticola TaxID=2786951 RepID=UPI0019341800|nr:tripartite tricarboxylate transporter substrate binding protein [Roseomonas ponticola]
MTLTRRRAIAAGALALPFVNAGTARAQATRPIVLVVPYAPGGGTDLTAREFAQTFSEALGGQTVIIENRGGAAGHIGSVSVARSRPDGNTLLFAVSTNLVVNPHMQRDGVDLLTALAPVAQITSYQYVLVIDPRLPVNTLQELIAYARARPRGDLTYSSGGVGNANHLAGVLFSDAVKIEMEHVPYRGTGPALLDVVAGRITMNFSSPPPAIQLAREGRLRAIAVTGDNRIGTLPEIPTLAQAGLPGVSITGWHGIFAPAGVAPEQLDRLERAARQAAATQRFAGRLEQDGLEPSPVRPRAEWFNAVREEHGFWGRKIRELDLKLE